MEIISSKLNHKKVQCINIKSHHKKFRQKNNTGVQKINMALWSGYFTVSTKKQEVQILKIEQFKNHKKGFSSSLNKKNTRSSYLK